MGNLRRIKNIIPLIVLFISVVNFHPSDVFGYFAVALVSFLASTVYAQKLKVDENVLIPFLFLSYFIGLYGDRKVLEKAIPLIFLISSPLILFTTVMDIFKGFNTTLRFGYRNVFFTPFIISLSLFLMPEAKRKMRLVYFLIILISTASMILFGNRTNYIALATLIAMIVAYRLLFFGLKKMMVQVGSIFLTFVGGMVSGVVLGYIMFGPLFIFYILGRFLSIFKIFSGETMDASAQIRIYDYSLAIDRFGQSPMFGKTVSDVLVRWVEGKIIGMVDNTYITVMWKLGMFGLGIFLVMLTYAFYTTVRATLKGSRFAFITLMLFVSLLIISTTTTALIMYIHIAALMVCVGVVGSYLMSDNP